MPYEAHYVVLHVGTGPSRLEEQQTGFSPMIVRDSQPRFNLSNDIWIERLDEQLAKNIQKACEPPHYHTTTLTMPDLTDTYTRLFAGFPLPRPQSTKG